MAKAYRLFRSRYSPLDTTGAALRGGRWNSPGVHVLYTSSSLALACLEVLVHIRNVAAIPTYKYCAISFPEDVVEAITEPDLSAVMESEVLARDYGDRWVKYGLIDNLSRYNKPVLMVPSVVIPVEMNFLFNPFHRDYATSVSVGDPRQFTFDPRLVSAR